MAFSIPSPSDKSLTVDSTESGGKLRSSLKRPPNDQQLSPRIKIPHRRVRFGTDQVKLITPLFGHDLWTHPGSNGERCRKDKKIIHANRSAGQYVKAHWLAYHQFTACPYDNIKPSVSMDIKKRLVFGVKQGHRSLERHYLHERKEQATRNVRSILFAYHRQGKRDDRLRLHSKRCSHTSRNWALFLASIDAAAAREESPPAFKPLLGSNSKPNGTTSPPPSKATSPSTSSFVTKRMHIEIDSMASILPDFCRLKIHDGNGKDVNTSNAPFSASCARAIHPPRAKGRRHSWEARTRQLLQQQKQQEKQQAKEAELRVMTALSLSCGGWTS